MPCDKPLPCTSGIDGRRFCLRPSRRSLLALMAFTVHASSALRTARMPPGTLRDVCVWGHSESQLVVDPWPDTSFSGCEVCWWVVVVGRTVWMGCTVTVHAAPTCGTGDCAKVCHPSSGQAGWMVHPLLAVARWAISEGNTLGLLLQFNRCKLKPVTRY